ncbi:prepilin-type N-terminal cleavage/methylation domain-containing protein [bacterium]|nr:prepilin-type N-terminal cleavage/methylation domain-containing protein [bacterium]
MLLLFYGIQIALILCIMLLRKKTLQRGFTTIELLVVVVIIGVLANVAVQSYLHTRDQARIAAATYDVYLLKKALGLYEADHGNFPLWDCDNIALLLRQLVDADGQPYINLSPGINFSTFQYIPLPDGESYLITVTTVDKNQTTIFADPQRTWTENDYQSARGNVITTPETPTQSQGPGHQASPNQKKMNSVKKRRTGQGSTGPGKRFGNP